MAVGGAGAGIGGNGGVGGDGAGFVDGYEGEIPYSSDDPNLFWGYTGHDGR